MFGSRRIIRHRGGPHSRHERLTRKKKKKRVTKSCYLSFGGIVTGYGYQLPENEWKFVLTSFKVTEWLLKYWKGNALHTSVAHRDTVSFKRCL